jgi:hypothetical protein
MRPVRALLCALALAAVGAPTRSARAGGPSFADREAARTLAGQGYELFEAGKLPRAIELFRQAEARFHAPPHLLYVARAQVKLGKMLEAEATYKLVTDEKLAPDAPGPFKEAQVSARIELTTLKALVPTLTIALEGEPPSGTRVLLDGEPFDARQLGVATRQNPGPHTVIAQAPGLPAVERAVILEPGHQGVRVPLPFARAPGSVVPAVIAFSVGAVGVGVGTTAAVLAIHAAAGKTTGLRIAEITGFAVGGAGVVAGVVLLAVRPRGAAGAAPPSAFAPVRLRASIGLGAVSLAGEF